MMTNCVEDSGDDSEDEDLEPVLSHQSIKHNGGVNRVRVCHTAWV